MCSAKASEACIVLLFLPFISITDLAHRVYHYRAGLLGILDSKFLFYHVLVGLYVGGVSLYSLGRESRHGTEVNRAESSGGASDVEE